jgi:hypothetical protein
MLSLIVLVIRIQVDCARLIYYRGQFWNMSLWCKNCNVYNTLEKSRLWFRTVIKHMTDLTTIHTSTRITTSVELVGRQAFLGSIPRFVFLTVRATFPLRVLVEGSGLRRPLKVCFSVLRMSPRFQSVRNTLNTTRSKVAVTARIILPINDRFMSLSVRSVAA